MTKLRSLSFSLSLPLSPSLSFPLYDQYGYYIIIISVNDICTFAAWIYIIILLNKMLILNKYSENDESVTVTSHNLHLVPCPELSHFLAPIWIVI